MNRHVRMGLTGIFLLSTVSLASAETSSWGNVLKSAGQAAGQAVVQQMSPQAQTTVDQAKKLAAGAPQENFLMAKAKEFMAAGNYQPALDLANYVITMVNSKSVDAKKIMADAKAALLKMAQQKLTPAQQTAAQQAAAQKTAAQQVQADAVQTGNSLKNLFGTAK